MSKIIVIMIVEFRRVEHAVLPLPENLKNPHILFSLLSGLAVLAMVT